MREIGEAVGLTSSSSVHAQLANLERKGLLHRDPTKPRAIGLADRIEGVTVPLVGRIAAGTPVLATEHVEDYVVGARGVRAATPTTSRSRVSGDSMIGAGIFDGDIVVVRPGARPTTATSSRRCCPVPAEDEATVKRLGHDGRRVMLIPENPALEPFEMTDGQCWARSSPFSASSEPLKSG